MKVINIIIGCILIPFLLLQKPTIVSEIQTAPHQKMNTIFQR